MSRVAPFTIREGDWVSVRKAIQKLGSYGLGPTASPIFAGLTISGLTASRLIATNSSKELTSVSDLASLVAGTTNQITVTNDGDGTITLATPQDIHTGASPTFADLTLSAPSNVYNSVQKLHLIDVTAEGVDNTGVTDAAADIQTLVNAAAVGSIIYLPKGTYRFESTVTLPAYIGFIGDGHFTTSISYVGTGIALTINPTPAPIGYGTRVGGFNMLGPSTVGTSTAIKVIDINRYLFNDILISRFNTGINLHIVSNYCEDNIFDSIHFTGSGTGNSLKSCFAFSNTVNGQDFDHNTFTNIWADLVNGSGVASTDFIWAGSGFTHSAENLTFENIILFAGGDSNAKFIHSLNAAHTFTRCVFDVHRVTTGYTTFIPFYLETSGDAVTYTGYVDGGAASNIAAGASLNPTVPAFDSLRLNNSNDACRLVFDVEGLSGAGHQSWAFQTDRNVNGDFTLLKGTVGATPGTVVLHSDASGNISIGKYLPGTKLDVDGVITATGGNSTNWNTAYTHVSNNGTDHSYINQSVKTTDSPSFIGELFLDAELTQPVTAYGTATSYGKIEPDSASDGGLRLWGFSDAVGQRALGLFGIIGVTDPTDTTPCITLAGGKSDGGTGATTIGNDETLFQIENWGTPRFKVMGDGALVIGGSETGITGTELEDLSDGGDTTLHTHSAYLTSPVAIANGGTGQTTAQNAINALTAVSGATAEHVLTKDTATGNAIFKAAAGGSDVKAAVDAAATADYIGATSGVGVVRTGAGLTKTDGGDYVTLAVSGTYVDRGDPAAWDWLETGSKAVLNTDNTWRDLDCSAIVPAGAIAILFLMLLKDDTADARFSMRKNGNTNAFAVTSGRTQVANISFVQNAIVACDTNRVVEYNGDNLAFTTCALIVQGWWI